MAIAPTTTTSGGAVLAVHRCRFVDWAPSAITAIAFPPLAPPNSTQLRSGTKSSSNFGALAVGHANGTIELCEWTGSESSKFSPQAWVVRRVEFLIKNAYFPFKVPTDGRMNEGIRGPKSIKN
jgi:hypothetical protein